MMERDALEQIANLLSGHRQKWARAAWDIVVSALAQGIEARRVETGTGSIGDESPVANGDAPNLHRRRVIDE